MTSIANPTRAAVAWALLAGLAGAPWRAAAVPANRSIALEGAVAAGPGAPSPACALAAGLWLEWELEAQARLSLESAPRAEGRATDAATSAEAGLRWVPDRGRWRPTLGLALGVRLPAGGRVAAPTARLQAGLERSLTAGWAVDLTAGARWVEREGAAAVAALGIRRYF